MWIRRDVRRQVVALSVALLVTALAGCDRRGPASVAATASADATSASSASGVPSPALTSPAGPSPRSTSVRPQTLVAVTAAGAVVLLDPDGGRVRRTLVPSGAVGDAVQLTPDDSYVYYEVGTGCRHQVWRIRVDGDSPQLIAAEGSRPALSSDGRRLAFALQRFPDAACPDLSEVAAAGTFQVVLVDLDGLVSTPYPMPPRYAATGLPAPVSHLSWSPDGTRLAVSIRSVQDNEGWQLHLMTPAKDRYYVSEDLAGDVPPGGVGDRHRFYSEGSYLPDGAMFVVHRCCTGYPLQAPEVAMEKIAPATGSMITRVAVGRATVEHTSLTSDATGHWLMYLSGTDLLVSDGGRTPVTLASGYLAADW